MKNVLKKTSALVLVLLMVLTFTVSAFAEESELVLDFSSLNRTPAGGYGYVVADNDNLAFNLNGSLTSVRFVGVSFDLTKGIPDKDVSSAMAEELYTNGVNLVVFDNVFAALSTETKELDEDKLNEFDILVHELYRKGIYIYLKMFTPSALGVNSVDMYYDTDTINAVQRFLKKFLSHYNLNQTTYAEDATLVCIQYSSDASMIWQNEGDTFVPSEKMQSQFNTWLTSRYEESMTAMRKLWNKGNYMVAELGDDEDFQNGTVKMGTIPTGGVESVMDWDNVMSYSRQADFMQFLADTEESAFASLTKYIRNLGYDGLFINSDTSSGPLSTKLAGTGDAAVKSLTYTSSMSLTDAFCEISSGVISGKPFFAEWDTSVSPADKAEAYLKLTMYASFQGWDALVLGEYAYEQTDAYNVKYDTEIWSLCGLYSNIFRSRYISEAKTSVDVVYSEADALCESGLYGVLTGNLVYFSKVGNAFLEKDEDYEGTATVAISSGNTASGSYAGANVWILHSSTSYTDQYLTAADKTLWINTEIQKVPKRTWVNKTVDDIEMHVTDEYIAVPAETLDTMEELSVVFQNLSAYSGKMIVDGVAYSDTDQLAYNLADGTLTLTGNRVMIISDDLSEGVTVSNFMLQTTSAKNNVVVYTPDAWYLSVGKEYIVYVGGMSASDTGTLEIARSNHDCVAYGINADGTRGEEVSVNSSVETSKSTIQLSGKYWLYEVVFTERDIDDTYVNNNVTAPEQEERPNLLLLITLPAAGFLLVAVIIVIINDRRRAKVEEELRVSSLAAIKKKQAEHHRKISRFDDEE